MSAETMAVPLPSPARLAQYWQSTKTAAKTVVVILAIIGSVHVTEPLRADAAIAGVGAPGPSPAGSKVGVARPGK